MSGRDLAGISSLARGDSAVQPATRSGNGAEGNGDALDQPDHQPEMSKPERQCKGLPSTVIHELRTPLTSIHGYAQVLQRSLRDNPRATNALGVVVRETTRLSGMLGTLSELAELQSGEVFSSPVAADVYQLAEDVVQEVTRRDAEAHPIRLEGAGVAHCNATLLSQSLLHVLNNAALYSPAGEPVVVRIAERGDAVEIEVSDRGIGVVPADGDRIYEPFERGSNARQFGSRGLGLGLYLARESLARTRGRIEQSVREDGGGTTFRLTVPRV
jgi:signal transduction histidine kinase